MIQSGAIIGDGDRRRGKPMCCSKKIFLKKLRHYLRHEIAWIHENLRGATT